MRDRYPGRAAAWIAEVDGVPAGSVCCVPDDPGDPRHRRYPSRTRRRDDGHGFACCSWNPGRAAGGSAPRLVERCLDFARAAGYTDIVLLTYDQLAAARRVYQAAGFTLDSEHPEDAFGQHMMCQTWSRPL